MLALQNECIFCGHECGDELRLAEPGGLRSGGTAADLWQNTQCTHSKLPCLSSLVFAQSKSLMDVFWFGTDLKVGSKQTKHTAMHTLPNWCPCLLFAPHVTNGSQVLLAALQDSL